MWLSGEDLLADIVNLPHPVLVLEISGQGEAGVADQLIIYIDESAILCQLAPVAGFGCVGDDRRR